VLKQVNEKETKTITEWNKTKCEQPEVGRCRSRSLPLDPVTTSTCNAINTKLI